MFVAIQTLEESVSALADKGVEEFMMGVEGRGVNPDWPAYRGSAYIAIPGPSARFRGREARDELNPGDGDRDDDDDVNRSWRS